VEGKLRELLNWGLAAPGGRGAAQRAVTYLTTALLGKQGEVSAIFDASLKGDQDETGRALVTRALDALGQDPTVARLLERLKEHSGEVYTAGGRHKRSADSPLVRAQAELREREEQLRKLQETARQGKEIEEQVSRLLHAREQALEARDEARAALGEIQRYVALAERRQQLDLAVSRQSQEFDRVSEAFRALDRARQEYRAAQTALTDFGDAHTQAANAANDAEIAAQAARVELARAQSAHESAEQLASSARDARVSELRARIEKAVARKGAAQAAVAAEGELNSLESRLAEAKLTHDAAQEELARASAELQLALLRDELREARELAGAVEAAATEQETQKARESAAAAAASEADVAWKATAARLEKARRTADERSIEVGRLETRILRAEMEARGEREELDRVRAAVQKMRRVQEAEAAAAELEASLAANEAEIAACEAELQRLEACGMELRRRTLASQVEELSAQEGKAREHRRRAAETRDSAARLEAEWAVTSTSGAASAVAVAPALLSAAGGGLAGFAAALYGASAGMPVSIGAAVLFAIVAGLLMALGSGRRRKKTAETARRGEKLRAEADGLRANATELDRLADSLLEGAAALASLRRELAAIVEEMAAHGGGAPQGEMGSLPGIHDAALRERDRLAQARRVRENLQARQLQQLALLASARAQADGALASGADPQAALAEAESRWRAAEAQLEAVRQESRQLTALPGAPAAQAPETVVTEAERAVTLAQEGSEARRRERQSAADELARASARLELARAAANGIHLSEIEQRFTAAQAQAGIGEVAGTSAAKERHREAKERAFSACATVELLAGGIPGARRKFEALAPAFACGAASELAQAEEEEGRLHSALRGVEAETAPHGNRASPSAEALRDAEQAAVRAEEELGRLKERAAAATVKRDELRGRVERTRGDLEASERQTQGMDLEEAGRALAGAREALDGLAAGPAVTAEQLAAAVRALADREEGLRICEGSLNEARGKLELVAGQVGVERVEEEKEAVQRAREHAEEQELEYEASRHLLELLEAAETKRASHLGRCLATPVAERFLALTGDLYAHVNLDPDLRLEGFVAAGGQHSVEELSVGTREQLATIVRLAIAAQLKTAVLLDDQLVHSDSDRIEWFRKQVRSSVREHDHQVIVMTCRLPDYAADDDGSLTLINILDVVQRVRPHRANRNESLAST
jgi:hypothetical protein